MGTTHAPGGVPPPSGAYAGIDGNRIFIRSKYEQRHLCKAVPGARWNPQMREWDYPRSPFTVKNIQAVFGDAILIAPELLALIEEKAAPVMPSKTYKPRHYQVRSFEHCYPKPAGMLALDMGTGKTLVAISLVNAWHCSRVLVLCPNSVRDVWPKEVALHSDVPFHVHVCAKGSVAQQAQDAARAVQVHGKVFVVQNYEAAIRPEFAQWAASTEWDCVICDESHRLKNGRSLTAKMAHALVPVSKHRLCMTGTPMSHSFTDIFSQYLFLDASIFGASYMRFLQRYAIMGGYMNHDVVGVRNEAELNQKFYQLAYRVMQEDVLDLPERFFVDRTFRLPPKAARVYGEIRAALRNELVAGLLTIKNGGVKMMRLQQLTSGYLPTDDSEDVETIHTEKLDTLRDVLQDIPKREPIVVFCRFVWDIQQIRALCEKDGRSVSLLAGAGHDLKEWQDGKTDVLVAQIQSGGVGINCTRACYQIYFSTTFSLTDYYQSLARTYRSGQTRPVTVIRVMAEDTIDERVFALLEQRQEVLGALLADLRDDGKKSSHHDDTPQGKGGKEPQAVRVATVEEELDDFDDVVADALAMLN